MSAEAIQVRSLTELDLDGIVRIGEKMRSRYEPDLWEGRVTYGRSRLAAAVAGMQTEMFDKAVRLLAVA